jgi:DNA-binding NtrC family response regulator
MFLDEIGDMSVALQAKLLQVLQDGEFARLGGKHDVHVDVRVIAATNRDLERAVASGQFREDLFFRLNVVSITMPPLRERRDEIPSLTRYFLKKYSVQYNKPHADLSPDTLRLLSEYDWPGNVRELENLIRRMVVLGGETEACREIQKQSLVASRESLVKGRGESLVTGRESSVTSRHSMAGSQPAVNGHRTGAAGQQSAVRSNTITARSPMSIATAAIEGGNYSLKDVSRTAAREAERELILRMLNQTRWNRKETAAILGISYKALLYKIKENGLDKVS